MSALTAFSDSDTVHLDGVEYDLDGPPQVAGHKSKTPSSPLCIPKTVGEVGLKLGALRHLGLYSRAEITIPLDDDGPSETYDNPEITLNLVPEGSAITLANGRIRQAYTVDEKPGAQIRYFGYDVHVDSIAGRIALDLVERDPWIETTGCGGEPRYVRVGIEPVPDESGLEIKGSAAGYDATLRATSLALSGSAASAGFEVGIGVNRTECGVIAVVPGGRQAFWGTVGTVPLGARTYAWNVKGGTIIGPSNLPHIDVQLTNVAEPDPNPVHVEMRVTIGALSALAAIDFKPDTPQDRLSKEIRCKIQGYLHHNFRADPLWDPLRDYVTQPLTRAEAVRLRDLASNLLRVTNRLLEHERG